MSKELDAFDLFVDDIISTEDNLLKGELDFLLMQYIFNSLELENLNDINQSRNSVNHSESDSYYAA